MCGRELRIDRPGLVRRLPTRARDGMIDGAEEAAIADLREALRGYIETFTEW